MSDEPSAETPKRKIHPLALIGPAVAIGASLFVVLLSNGKKDEEQPATLAAQTAPGDATQNDPAVSPASAPHQQASTQLASKIEFEDETLTFAAELPAAPPDDPVIALLRQDGEAYLAKMKIDARAAFNERKKAGIKDAPGWDVSIQWAYTAKAGGVVSLLGTSSEYQGGAHPMTKFDTLIARETGEKLKLDDMLTLKRSPSPAMVVAICEGLKSAKQDRIGSPTIFDDPIVCAGPKTNVKLDQALIALAPSNQANKFGGLNVYFQAYEVGPYVEGSYEFAIQQEVFAEDLKPEFKLLFAGKAPPLKQN